MNCCNQLYRGCGAMGGYGEKLLLEGPIYPNLFIKLIKWEISVIIPKFRYLIFFNSFCIDVRSRIHCLPRLV